MSLTLPAPHPAPWRSVTPADRGFDAKLLAEAVNFAAAHATPWPNDIASHIAHGYFEGPPHNEILGPVSPRGAPNGLVTRNGVLVASWGDTRQSDMTFSVAKSYLSLLAGLALADGLIPDLDARIGATITDGGFETPQNAGITWRHILTNTSEWEGELFGKSDIIDRGRNLVVEGKGQKGQARPMQPPGSYWEYNDVRVNRLALSLLRLFRKPLPEVFYDRILKPIGGSTNWRWEGYRTSWVEIEGRRIQSVSGGGHWGGGVVMHAEDQARIGLLMLGRGAWNGTRILPESWIDASTTPCALNPSYGFLWWLNSDGKRLPSAAKDAVFASGAGGNTIWIDPSTGIVAVSRWMDPAALDGFIGRVRAALA
ncbi:MAG: serine hydrolase [Rhodospirillales bacterium]|jgi:CubicO group peptidase (beta-lactamase class C family)|nr:serine hydrolase [Rhodospirillales bacterium]